VNATRLAGAAHLARAADPAKVSSPTANKPRTIGLLQASALASGAGMVFIVARDGSPPWQVTRLLVTATLTAAAIVVLGRGAR
jgi:hypothetical protein